MSDTRRLGPGDTGVAGRLLGEGSLVVIPTETVYGLAASAVNEQAVAAIFAAKGRPADNPLIVHFDSVESLLESVPSVSGPLLAALKAFAPGPLTVVAPRPAWVPHAVCGGLDTIAVRVPAHPLAREIIAAAGVPVAAPSANRSGRPSPTDCAAALAEMDGRVAAVVDGGPCSVGIESTVIAAAGEQGIAILRPGLVTAQAIERATGCRVVASAQENHRSPGTRYRHYRPTVPVALAAPATLLAARDLSDRVTARLAILARRESGGSYQDFAEMRRHLYRDLLDAERRGVCCVLCERVGAADEAGLADRLARAAERVIGGLSEIEQLCGD